MTSLFLVRKSVFGLAMVSLVGLAGQAKAQGYRPYPPPVPSYQPQPQPQTAYPASAPAPTQPQFATFLPRPQAPGAITRDSFEQDRAALQSEQVRTGFPRLRDFEIVGPGDKNVNAFGAALGLAQWILPEAGTQDNPLAGMDRLFAQYGYRRAADMDVAPRQGVEKIVLYATVTPDGGVKDITSAAHQDTDGSWTMKLGQLCKVRIRDLVQAQGPQYGLPYAVYTR